MLNVIGVCFMMTRLGNVLILNQTFHTYMEGRNRKSVKNFLYWKEDIEALKKSAPFDPRIQKRLDDFPEF